MGKSSSSGGKKSKSKSKDKADKKSKSKKSKSKSSSSSSSSAAAPPPGGAGTSLDLSGNLHFEAGRIFGRYGVNGFVDKSAFKQIVRELEAKVPPPARLPMPAGGGHAAGGPPPEWFGPARPAPRDPEHSFESGYLYGQYGSSGGGGQQMSPANFESLMRDARRRGGMAPPVDFGRRAEPPAPFVAPVAGSPPNFAAVRNPANRVYGEQLARRRQQLLRHCRDVQALQYEMRMRHQQVEDDIASFFNELLDDLRASEEQKTASLREALDVCADDLRALDALGVRLQAAPHAAGAVYGGLSASPDAQALAADVQRALARPLPPVNAGRCVAVPNRLAELRGRAQRHDDLAEQVHRQGDELGRTLEEKEQVESEHQRTAREFDALRDKSSREISQWVDLTDKLTDELEFARAEVLRLEQVAAGVAQAAADHDVGTIQALVGSRHE